MTEHDIETSPRSRSLLKRGCGCLALVFGALIVAGIFAPSLVGGVLADRAEEGFAEHFEGQLSIPGMDLAWSSRQRVDGVELRDPKGAVVASASVEAPSIFELLNVLTSAENRGPILLGSYRLELDADIRVDDEGRSNLDAALAERNARGGSGGSRRSGDIEIGGSGPIDEFQRLEFELELVAKQLRWTDARLDVAGHMAALHDVQGSLELSQGQVKLLLAGAQECETRGSFELLAELSDFAAIDGEVQPQRVRAALEASELSAALVDRLAALDGELGALLGDRFALSAKLAGNPKADSAWSAELTSEASRVALAGELSPQRFELTPGTAVLHLDPEVAASRVQAWSARVLPEGTTIEVPSGQLEINLRELELGADVGSTAAETLRMSAILDLGAFTVVDPMGQGGADRLELGGLGLALRFEPGAAPVAQLVTSFVESPDSELKLEVELEEGWDTALAEEREDDIAAQLRITARDFPLDRARKLLGVEDRLEDLVGGRLDLTGSAQLAQQNVQRVQLAGSSEQVEFELAADLGEGRLKIEPGGLVASMRVTKLGLADLLRESMPAGSVLSAHDQELALKLETGGIALDLAQLESDAPLEGAVLDVTLHTGALDYTDSVLAPRATQLSLQSSSVQLSVAETGEARLDVEGALNADGSGSLELSLVPSSKASELLAGDTLQSVFDIDGTLKGFPTRVVDAYAEQDGLLVDVLGPSVDVKLKSAGLGASGGPLELNASSKLGTFAWRGRVEVDDEGQATLLSGDTGQLKADVALSPLLGERVVGPLVPLLVNLSKPDTTPIGLSATEVLLPLDGNLRGLDAKLRLDLGQVSCSFLPALARELPGMSSKAVQDTLIEPIDMQIIKGVVHYDRLPLKVDGRLVDLAGSYDLVSSALDLSTEVQLGDLGGELGQLLKSARKALGDDYAVPLRIGGTTSRPHVGLAPGFLEATLKQVGEQKLEDELERGLRKLFGD